MDKETEQFAADVLESIRQAKRGEYAHVHTPEDIQARIARRGLANPCECDPAQGHSRIRF